MRRALIAAWRQELQTRLDRLVASQGQAREGTRVDGSHRPANRGERAAVTSAGYLALGLGQRAAELAEALRLLEEMGEEPRSRVRVGALMELDDDGESRWVALLPGGDATTLHVEGVHVQVLSAQAPLAVALAGLEEGDCAQLRLPAGVRELEVLRLI